MLFYSSFVDITGDPEKSRLDVFAQTNNSLSGNPFSGLGPDLNDSVDSDPKANLMKVLLPSLLGTTIYLQSWNKGILTHGYTLNFIPCKYLFISGKC